MLQISLLKNFGYDCLEETLISFGDYVSNPFFPPDFLDRRFSVIMISLID
jgi:hypothetical protein